MVMKRRKSDKTFGFHCGGPTDVRAAVESVEEQANSTLQNFDGVRIEVQIVGQSQLAMASFVSDEVGEELNEENHKVE